MFGDAGFVVDSRCLRTAIAAWHQRYEVGDAVLPVSSHSLPRSIVGIVTECLAVVQAAVPPTASALPGRIHCDSFFSLSLSVCVCVCVCVCVTFLPLPSRFIAKVSSQNVSSRGEGHRACQV
jgi:hypothetical protein